MLLNILKRRVFDQEIVGALVIWVAILALPEVTTGKFVESEHIGNWYLRDGAGEELWSLVCGDGHESTTIRPTQNHKMLVVGVPLILQELSRTNKIVKTFLSVLLNS